jgi:ribulose-phosphate 3-epimerase
VLFRSQVIIQVDGGVDLNNYREIVKAGANALVAGSSVFSSENPIDIISRLKRF